MRLVYEERGWVELYHGTAEEAADRFTPDLSLTDPPRMRVIPVLPAPGRKIVVQAAHRAVQRFAGTPMQTLPAQSRGTFSGNGGAGPEVVVLMDFPGVDVPRIAFHPKDEPVVMEHPFARPLWLMRDLVVFATARGAVVVDSYCGSGSTLMAARSAGRRAIGVEIREDYCEVAARRLRDSRLDGGRAVARTVESKGEART